MNDKFDELTKGLAQSVTRRGALRKFGVGEACWSGWLCQAAGNARIDRL